MSTLEVRLVVCTVGCGHHLSPEPAAQPGSSHGAWWWSSWTSSLVLKIFSERETELNILLPSLAPLKW
jgi:hypothetical protein